MSEEGDDELDVQLQPDVYDAVIAAAFGGVRVALPLQEQEIGKKETKAPFIRIHPAAVFCFSTLLFVVQLSCITCLVLDINLKESWETATWEEFNNTPGRRILLCTKILMTIVLQMICLKEFLAGFRPLFFVLNPVTWMEIWRPPRTKGSGLAFHAVFCLPFCILSQLCQLTIAYIVSSVSITIILKTNKVSEAIFNGLVITFLLDLDEHAFSAATAIFHVDGRFYNLFKLKINNEKDGAHGAASVAERTKNVKEGNWRIWLHRGRGGKVQIIENLIIFGILAVIYFRQIFLFTQAIDTGILPLTRDVCRLYRGLDGDDMMGHVLLNVADFVTLVDYKQSLRNSIERFDMKEDCFRSDMQALTPGQMHKYYSYHPRQVGSAVVVMLMVFVIPQLLLANHMRITRIFSGLTETEGGSNEVSPTKPLISLGGE